MAQQGKHAGTVAHALQAPATQRFVHRRDLLRELVGRDLKLRYKRSVLGILWSLVTPLSQLLVLNFVFTTVLPLDIPRYGSFLFIGILVWSWLQTSLDQATGSIVDNRELARQPGFPLVALPVVTVAANLIHFALALPILAVFLWVSGSTPGLALMWLPVLVALQFVLTTGVACLVAAFHVTFRDTKHLLNVLLLLGFYLTPVFYATEQVPERFRAAYGVNPMVPLIESYRAVLLQGRAPAGGDLLLVASIATGLLVIGHWHFTHTSYRFVDEL